MPNMRIFELVVLLTYNMNNWLKDIGNNNKYYAKKYRGELKICKLAVASIQIFLFYLPSWV